ncbi:MAG TPA: hypothetical protein VJQ79_11485 [Acidimicrobiia bacterium]|nr:hypothetical protein [Acidimicrobiia bacterium]
MPSAEDLGTSTAALLKKGVAAGRTALRGIAASCRQWWTETKQGLRDLVDLESLKVGADESRHVERPEPPARPVRTRHATRGARTPAPTPSTPSPQRMSARPGVELVEKSAATREHLLEVSVLESLGFFDPANEVVVTIGSVENSYPPQPAPVPSPAGGRQLIPDIDLTSWKPHVIARSKLGRSRVSTTTIVVLSITLLALAIITVNLLRAPAEQAAIQEDGLAAASTQLGNALAALEPVLINVNTDVAEATSVLISVDSAARDLFDAAALLGDEAEQQVLRQSAAALAERALALESSLGDALNYRLVLNPLWNSPDLAGVVDPTAAAAEVATWQAQLLDMVESLPTSTELGAHVEQVRGFVDGLEAWRVRYLDALALSDVATAEAAVADLDGQLALLAQSGEDTLSGLFEDAGTERSRILSDLANISG